MQPQLTAATAILCVRDIAASLAYYDAALGFPACFRWGNPPTYACLCRDDVELHLVAQSIANRPPGQAAVAIFVRDVDAIHAELAARGAQITTPRKPTPTACATSTSPTPTATA